MISSNLLNCFYWGIWVYSVCSWLLISTHIVVGLRNKDEYILENEWRSLETNINSLRGDPGFEWPTLFIKSVNLLAVALVAYMHEMGLLTAFLLQWITWMYLRFRAAYYNGLRGG